MYHTSQHSAVYLYTGLQAKAIYQSTQKKRSIQKKAPPWPHLHSPISAIHTSWTFILRNCSRYSAAEWIKLHTAVERNSSYWRKITQTNNKTGKTSKKQDCSESALGWTGTAAKEVIRKYPPSEKGFPLHCRAHSLSAGAAQLARAWEKPHDCNIAGRQQLAKSLSYSFRGW